MKKTTKQKILLYGGSGQIGSRFVELLRDHYSIVAPTHQEVDVTDRNQVEAVIQNTKPDHILYAAGFTSIDKAPENAREAFLANAGAMMIVCNKAKSFSIPVCYISTDIVFNGRKNDKPYTEKDSPDPLSLNAQFKRIGEFVTIESSSKNLAVRLDVCYSAYYPRRLDLARLAASKVAAGEKFTATRNQKINPIFVDDLVKAIEVMIARRATGIYHVGALDYTSPYQFAKKIARKLGLDETLVQPAEFEDFARSRPEPRPQNEWLDTKKFRRDFGNRILHTIDESIDLFVKQYRSQT